MLRGVQWPLCGSIVVAALIALAGCSHYLYGERETWRRDAEVACLNSGAVKEGPQRVRISAISGPGICGADFPLRVSALGEDAPLGYDDEPLRPPSAIPDAALPQRWPIRSDALPPAQSAPPQHSSTQYGTPPPAPAPPGSPMSIYAPGVPVPEPYDVDFQPTPPRPYDRAAAAPSSTPPSAAYPPQNYPPQTGLPETYPPPRSYPPPTYSPPVGPAPAPLGTEQYAPRGWPRAITAAGPVGVNPPATLACPIVSALDQWVTAAVQPAALRWFREPIIEIKQISAYSCRGMNGDPNAHVSEHAFGNALDIAEFTLADGRKISVQYGWRGTPEEQGFLHDVQLAACNEFSTVLAPGANVYHYNHIHVDLMRRTSGRRICEPAAIAGEVVAERARARYAAQHYGDPGVTGALKRALPRHSLGYSGEDDDNLPAAVPGDD
jgi:hypothetical protein